MVLPVSRASLELVRESLASGDRERVTRALHFLGRTVDTAPAATPAAAATAAAADSGGRQLLPLRILAVPPPHRDDPVYVSLCERVLSAIVGVAVAAAGPAGAATSGSGLAGLGLDPSMLLAAAVPRPPQPGDGPAAPSASSSSSDSDPVLLQTALSVVRKLHRSVAPYVAAAAGGTLAGLLAAFAHAPAREAPVLERTLDEVAERLPVEVTLAHLVACAHSQAMLPPPPAAATPAAGAGSPLGVTVAAFKALARLVPRTPAHLLLNECGRGRLLEAAAAAFGSPSTDVRRSVVALLVALALALGHHFTRYAEAYLTEPQQKLLAIYVAKAAGAGVGAVAGSSPSAQAGGRGS